MRISDWSADVCSSDLKCLHTDDLPTGKQHPMQLKRIYWIATALLALMYLAGGAYYLSDMAGVQAIYPTLGYPPYLVPILAVLKPLAAVPILWRFSVALSDLAYINRGELRGYARPEERRGGKEGVSTCRSRGAPFI